MNIRKIAVVGSFAVGGALAFAPLASADDLTSTIDTEIAAMNAIFQSEATLAGVGSDVATTGGPTVDGSIPFDIIKPADIAIVQDNGTTPFDFLVYGVNPTAAGLASDPGAYTVFNGALTEFDDAFNSELYGLLNSNALIPAADLFGSSNEIATALATGTDMGAATEFFSAGLADLSAFFGV